MSPTANCGRLLTVAEPPPRIPALQVTEMTRLLEADLIAGRRYWWRSGYHTRKMDAFTLLPVGA